MYAEKGVLLEEAEGLIRKALELEPNNGYRSEEHTSELQSLMRISYAVFCLKKKNNHYTYNIVPIIYIDQALTRLQLRLSYPFMIAYTHSITKRHHTH